jgi:hypothetical protein
MRSCGASRSARLIICRGLFSLSPQASQREIAALCTIVSSVRMFSTTDPSDIDKDYGSRMKDVPVLTGHARPVAREAGWVCKFRLNQRMEEVIPIILKAKGWTDEQVQREINGIYFHKGGGVTNAALNIWTTVEEYQRTPWFRRFRPSDTRSNVYISYEALKLLETELIPPSLRSDPYSHLRKRHLEDNWLNDKHSESAAKYVTKEALDRYTKGSENYGTVTRKKFLEFESKFRKSHGGMPQINEAYNSWQDALKDK